MNTSMITGNMIKLNTVLNSKNLIALPIFNEKYITVKHCISIDSIHKSGSICLRIVPGEWTASRPNHVSMPRISQHAVKRSRMSKRFYYGMRSLFCFGFNRHKRIIL